MSPATSPTPAGSPDVLERALAALPATPPPPPVDGLFAPGAAAPAIAAEESWRRNRKIAVAAGLLAFVGTMAFVGLSVRHAMNALARETAARRARDDATAVANSRISTLRDADVGVTREGTPVPLSHVKAGDVVGSASGAVIRLDGRVSITLDPHASLTLLDAGAVGLGDSSRAAFEVGHDTLLDADLVGLGGSSRAALEVGHGATSFRVRAGAVWVTDLGTRFTVDRTTQAARDRVLVTVEEGRVEANGIPLGAGEGLAFEDGVAVGGAWRLDAKPAVTLEVEDPTPHAASPVILRVVLSNPTEGWVGWPSASAARTPLMLNVVDPSGAPIAVRVTDAMVLTENPFGRAIPPHGSLVLRVRFERTFASPGTYRLRAVYRPAGEVESPTSPEVVMEVR